MKAIGLTRYLPIADPESLVDVELADPVPTGHDLLVRVRAVSVNPVDTKVRRPKADVEPSPKVLGWDASGVVEAVGENVAMFRPGDEVWYAGDITRQGCNSELQLVDERIVSLKPRTLGFAAAASLPLTSLTVWEAFFDRMRLDPEGADRGRTLLIIGGAGGVGSIGIQVAKLAGLTVIATASRPETRDWCAGLGADHVIDHSKPLRGQIEALGLSGVELILNAADTNRYWDACCDLIAPQGTICGIVGASALRVVERLLADADRGSGVTSTSSSSSIHSRHCSSVMTRRLERRAMSEPRRACSSGASCGRSARPCRPRASSPRRPGPRRPSRREARTGSSAPGAPRLRTRSCRRSPWPRGRRVRGCDLAAIRAVLEEGVVQQPGAAGLGEELGADTEQAARGDLELDADAAGAGFTMSVISPRRDCIFSMTLPRCVSSMSTTSASHGSSFFPSTSFVMTCGRESANS
jgi:NADPH:quinone reductase